MRAVRKIAQPKILEDNHLQWLADHLEDRTNSTKKYRYRARDIKQALLDETGSKCVYCESKVGHNTPGDVEHMIPSSVAPHLHFSWMNLTVACSECNRRKNDYFDSIKPFLSPYTDDVEGRVVHYGPVVGWAAGDEAAEITIRILELNTQTRLQLILRKVEKLEELMVLGGRIASEENAALKAVLEARLDLLSHSSAEYSAMVCAALRLTVSSETQDDALS